MEFGWHAAKHERNLLLRGFGFDAAMAIFKTDVLEHQDTRREYGEVRMRAVGEVRGSVLVVIYTDREEMRWIISARRANRKERKEWNAWCA